MKKFIVDIYEENEAYPAVRHIFIGKTKKETHGNFKAHLSTDSFLRDAVEKGEWEGIKLSVKYKEK